jgi:hypothetical protein
VLVAATLLVASVVAPSLFVASARVTAFESGLRAAQDAPYGPQSADLRVTWDSTLDERGFHDVLGQLSSLTAYGEPVVTAAGVGQRGLARAIVQSGGLEQPAVLWYHDGAVPAIAGGADAPPGIWLSRATADGLRLKVGDPVRIGLRRVFGPKPKPLPETVLAGVYDTVPGSSLPAALADRPDAARWYLPSSPDAPVVGTPLAIVDLPTFQTLARRVGESPLYFADMALRAGVTPDEAADGIFETQLLGVNAFDTSTDLGAALTRAKPPARLEVVNGLSVIAEAADETADRAQDQVRPYVVAGQVLALVVLVAAWGLLMHSRRREQVLVSGLGLRPAETGLLAVLEALPAAVLAAPAGLGLALVGLLALGPGDGALPPLTRPDLERIGVAVLGVLVLVGATAVLVAAAADRMAALSRLGRARRPVPWALALLAVTAVVAVAVFGAEAGDRTHLVFTMALPLLVFASVAVVVTPVLGWLRSRLPLRPRAGSVRWLAGRRTGTVVRDVTALTAVVAIALGMFAYTLTVRRGIDEGVVDKTAALAGARTTIEVAEDFRGHGRKHAVGPPAAGTSVVWRRGASMPPAYGDQHVMAVDTRTFAQVADWGATGTLERVRAELPRLDREAHGLPVLLIGDSPIKVGDQGTLDFGFESAIPFQVVGRAEAFPGSAADSAELTVVVSSRRLLRLLQPPINPRRKGATSHDVGAFTSSVWYDGPPGALRSVLTKAHVAHDGAVATTDQARIGAGLVAAEWAGAYALALGVVVLILAIAATLVLALRLSDRDRVSDVLLRRMGYSAQELARSRVWEAGYAVVSAVVVASAGGVALFLAPSMIDAVASVPPLTRPQLGTAEVVVGAVVVAALIVLVWLTSAWRATRGNPAEVLRGGE